MNKLRNVFAFASLMGFLFTSSVQSQAMIRPSLIGGVNDLTNSGGGLGFTAGLDLAIWLGPAMDLTLGGEFLYRSFTDASNMSSVHIPALLYFHFGPMLGLGAGGFYELPVSSGGVNNFGIAGALRIRPGLTRLFIEGRVNYGLDTSDWGGVHTTDIQGLLGISF